MGSASIEVWLTENDVDRKIVFSESNKSKIAYTDKIWNSQSLKSSNKSSISSLFAAASGHNSISTFVNLLYCIFLFSIVLP